MHPSIQSRREVLAVLRERTRLATAEFYELAGIVFPVVSCRHKVIPVGKAYHVTDSATGKVKGFRFTHQAACELAKVLDDRVLRSSQ
ncbi:hypothetical protein PMM47T1_14045 [Pseudomonas sp. M47T1]|uniref:hypothetical protein n=1 Tax=Pseudomonas sp. M47T1 TaxID=1179778 RepID=UPI0002608835|nr:hypothetical protein [Pseudomonas sp. M47T1]EIK96087.1 hypothetical protein PMM47T1_14045 [Pseudomonas sp. M47T1]